jgi:enoyl-CoA hydratase/carnithine racemase
MPTNDLIVSYPDFFMSEFREDSLWLKFSGNFFHNALSFDRRNFLHDYFERIRSDKTIKTLVIHSAFHESGSDEYMRFFLFECPERNLGHLGFSNTMDRYDLHRFCNIVDQTILDIATMNKMIVHICSGDVLSLFMNISMACDYRIVAADTVFHNVYQEIGMLPKGGAPFFLCKTLGASRAKTLMLLNQLITAREAMDNRIADRVVPLEDLESAAAEVARKFNLLTPQTLQGVKKLTHYAIQELKEYLELETHEIIKIGQREQFSDQ